MAEEAQTEPAQKTSSNKGLIIALIILLVVLISGGAFAGWMLLGQKEEASNQRATPNFMKMEPFIITLKNESRPHYLQIKLSLMSRNPETLEVLENYRPMVRNEMVRYLNTLAFKAVTTPEAPDMIRATGMTRINELLEKEQVGMTIDDIIITDLVIQ